MVMINKMPHKEHHN